MYRTILLYNFNLFPGVLYALAEQKQGPNEQSVNGGVGPCLMLSAVDSFDSRHVMYQSLVVSTC